MGKTQSGRPAPSRRILIVEDMVEMRQIISLRLQRQGFIVMPACRGEEALDLIALQGLPHLAVVDICLPGMDGFAFAAALQRRGNVPIIFLSARADIETKVEALTRYAEDFIAKPFVFAEFLARIRRILLRSWPDSEPQVDVVIDSRLSINFYQHYARLDSRRIQLTPIESRILQALYAQRGRVVSPGALLANVWTSDQQATIGSLWVHIRRLRQKLEPDLQRPYYIMTVRGRGYYLPALQRRPLAELPACPSVRAEDLNDDLLFASLGVTET